MSESTLYIVYKTTVRTVNEYRNGRLSAPVIWDHLAQTYLGWSDGMARRAEDARPLWRLAQNDAVPLDLRIAHAMTFDNALVTVDQLKVAAAACRAVSKLLSRDNHWAAIGDDLDTIKTKDKRVLGVALNCTSVSDQWRWDRSATGEVFCAVGYANHIRYTASDLP